MSDCMETDVFIFSGQNVFTANASRALTLSLQDASLPIGHALLLACHEAFITEFNSLTRREQAISGLTLTMVSTPLTLLEVAQDLRTNAIIANTNLYLIQLLRYLANDGCCRLGPDINPIRPRVGIIGFSTGMFAASVVATADSIPSLLCYAVEAFRLAFWLGFRAQKFSADSIVDHGLRSSASAPWSLICFGSTRHEIEHAVKNFNTLQLANATVYVTAVSNDSCITVSGRPDLLSTFHGRYLPTSVTCSKYADICTLYHSPELSNVKKDVMEDVARRSIRFPSYAALRRPLRSTFTGSIISSVEHDSSSTLVEEVIDMILLHPVNMDRLIDSIRTSLSSVRRDLSCRLVNVGPGTALWRSLARALPGVQWSMVDWSSRTDREPFHPLPYSTKKASLDEAPNREPIAIVGMAVKYPGAKDADGLWDVLRKGLNTVAEIPSSRFDFSDYTSLESTRRLRTIYGNFVDNPDIFDNAFFHISPREARSMDPQQRMLLHVSYHALENAGYVPHATTTFDPDTFATFVGVATNDYVQNLREDVDVYYSTGTLPAFLPGKISYAFGFSGPSMVIDTACSSSMVAIYQACRALNDRDCNAAIAGGVNVISSPDTYIGLDRAHFLSPTGQCKPWDASADGYCRSEGCGMFVLKRLSDALAENDNILGIIRGIEINQSANAASITLPHVPTQTNLFKKLISSARVSPARINVVEAHGTGTKAGDPAELESIRTVFASGRSADNPLHLTSIKANIGHAEAASGAASLAKLILMIRHRGLPAVISLQTLNPNIKALDADGIRIDTELALWDAPRDGGRRLALLNNFGAAGSNAALILEEPPEVSRGDSDDAATFIIGLSCESEAAAEELRLAYIHHIEENIHDSRTLADFAYTATARRQLHRYRLSACAKSKEELCNGLRNAPLVHVNDIAGKVIFVFSGQGGQYIGMGTALYQRLPEFRRLVDRCHEQLLAWGFPGILNIIDPPAARSAEDDLQASQSAVFVLECALSALWVSWGIKPDAVAGHSLGEYAALVAANVLSVNDGLRLVAGRARLLDEKCQKDRSGMLAIRMSPSQADELLKADARYSDISIACYNSAVDCVAAGEISQLELLATELKRSGCKCVRVEVPFAYHTSAMAPILEGLIQLAAHVKLSPPSMPVLSGVLGTVVSAGDATVFTPQYFARHLMEPVQFEQCVQQLLLLEEFAIVSAWIEIGPHPTTLPMLRSIPVTSQQSRYLPSLKKSADDWEVLGSSLSSLYSVRTLVDWRKVFATISPFARLIDIPAYPFAKTSFWVAFKEELPRDIRSSRSAMSTRFSLLGSCRKLPAPGSGQAAVFENPIANLAHLIDGHKVVGFGLCPASVYMEIASAGAQILLEHLGLVDQDTGVGVCDIAFSNPLIHAPNVQKIVRLEIRICGDNDRYTGKFEVASFLPGSPDKIKMHCSGMFDKCSATATSAELAMSSTMVERRKIQVLSGSDSPPETFYTRTVYDVIFSRIVAYDPPYQTVKSITIDSNGVDVYAVMQLPPNSSTGNVYMVNPVFMDTLLHVAGFAINCNAGPNVAFICSQVDKVKVVPALVKPTSTYGVYCTIDFLSDALAVADSYAFELGASGATVVAHMSRIRFRKLRMSGFKNILSTDASPNPSSDLGDCALAHSRDYYSATPLDMTTEITLNDPGSPCRNFQNRSAWLIEIKQIMASVLDIHTSQLDMDHDLERLGLDSLSSMEAHHSLCVAFKMSLPEDLFSTCKTIRDLQSAIVPSPTRRQILPTGGVDSETHEMYGTDINPMKLQDGNGSDALPLFLIHDGGGTAHVYAKLSSLGRRVWAIHNPKFATRDHWDGGLLQMADCYAHMVKETLDDDGGCLVGGWSYGGVVAFEIARQLMNAGIHVPGIVLIDSPHPNTRSPLSDKIIDAAFASKTGSGNFMDLIKIQIKYATRALVEYDPSQSSARHLTPAKAVMLRSREGFFAKGESTPSAAFLADRSDPTNIVAEWEKVLGTKVPVIDIPGNHFQVFDSRHVAEVSQRLKEALRMLSE